MGPYVFANTALFGFFAFATLHYAWQWWICRRESSVLVFAVHCAFCSLLYAFIVGIATSTSLPGINLALSGRTTSGLLVLTTTAWMFSRVTGVRAHRYLNFMTALFPSLAAINILVYPLHRIVTRIGTLALPWGEIISTAGHTPAGWWGGPIYIVAESVNVFGLFAARRLWERDRTGGTLVGLASAMGLFSVGIACLADIFKAPLPYVGGLPNAFWIPLLALLETREYRERNERLTASERRFRAIFDQTFQFIGLLKTDGTLLEANRTALEFAGVSAEDVIGKLFWQTPWWSHSPTLQEQVRQAVVSASRGEFVRFEATHSAADGTIRYVDFSLKPVCDEAGQVVLLIPESRDITVWKQSELALQKSQASLNAFINSIPQPAFLLDRSGVFLMGNEALAARLGLKLEEVIGQDAYQSLPPEVARNRKVLTGEVFLTGKSMVFEDVNRGHCFINHLSPVVDASGKVTMVAVIALDITERKQVEESLREASEFNRQIIASTNDGLIVLDREFRYQVWNPAMERISGLSAQDVIGKRPLELFPFLREAGVVRMIERAVAGETVSSPDFPYKVPLSGREGWTSQTMGPLRSADGAIIGVLSTVRDVTARIEVEQSLRESEARYRTLVESAPEAILVLDVEQGTFVEVNANARRLFGMTEDELMKRGPLDLSPSRQPDGRSSVESSREKIQQALAGETPRFEWVHRDSGGHEFPCEISLVRLPSTTRQLIRSCLIDVTARKQAEEALRRKDVELRRVIESDMMGIVFWNMDGLVVEGNDYFLNLVEYRREDLAAGAIRWTDLTLPEYEQADQRAREELLERGTCTPYEKQFITRSGNRVPVLVGAAIFEGDLQRGVAFVLDLSLAKRLEEQIRRSQKMQAIGQLAGGVAHDFNNLLTIIFGHVELMGEVLPSDNSLHRSVKAIVDACSKAASLTRQLLVFSRQQRVQPAVVNLNDVVSQNRNILQHLIGEQVTLVMTLEPDTKAIKADPSQLEQVLMNLAVNARDAMPQGGTLTIETRNVFLDDLFRAAPPDAEGHPYSMLMVGDTGSGMDEATKAHIFEPFFTTKESGKGTGLGLATVHGIVEQAGGYVEVASQVGQGTIFKIYLPQIADPLPHVELAPVNGDMPRGNETVLMVEDEDGVRSMEHRVLQECGYTILEARNGSEALEIAEKHAGNIDLLASDVVLPQMNGRQLAERLANLFPACKVLLVSGRTDDDVTGSVMLDERFEFLSKPFTPRQFAQKVREVLDRKI